MTIFVPGWHQINSGRSGPKAFSYCMISVNRLLTRKSYFAVNNWLLDSGAYSRINSGKGHLSVKRYAAEIVRWYGCGNLIAAVSQDFLCDKSTLAKTGLTISEHQKVTLLRYDRLLAELPENKPYIMPVLQGFEPNDYIWHLYQYGDRLTNSAWVGIGSLCQHNCCPGAIRAILLAIKAERPDLKLHGFGVKLTALRLQGIRDLLCRL